MFTEYRKSDLDRFREMVLPLSTISQNDYVAYPIRNPEPPAPKPEIVKKQMKKPVLTDLHTMTPYIRPISTTNFIRPKDILQTNPRKAQQRFENPETEVAREHSRKTRPRIAIVPFINIDDIEDKRRRDIILKSTYSTTTKGGLEGMLSLSRRPRVLAPLPEFPAPSIMVKLNKVQHPYVSPEWRMTSMDWEHKQLRGHTEPDSDFWTKYKSPFKCHSCKQTEKVEQYRKSGLIP